MSSAGESAQVVRVRLERQAPRRDRAPGERRRRAASRTFPTTRSRCSRLFVDHRGVEHRRSPRRRGGGGAQQRGGVLREARAAPARAGVEELEPDPRVVAHAEGDLAHVGVDRLAEVGDRVDERHLRGQERVRRVLDHLRRRRARHQHRCLHVAVQLGHPHRDRRGRRRRSPPGTARGSRGPRCLRAGTRGSTPRRPRGRRRASRSSRSTRLARADRHRRLVHHDGPGGAAPARPRGRRPRPRRGRRRRRRPRGSGRTGRRTRRRSRRPPRRPRSAAAAVARPSRHQLGQAFLEDPDLALREAADLVGVDVADDDLVARGGPGTAPVVSPT